MGLGTLPYKAKISQANPDNIQGRTLIISIYDGSANFRNQVSIDVQDPMLQNVVDVRLILDTMQAAIAQQLIADAGDLGVGLDAISTTLGG
jgi:hypothetical protein